MLRAAIEAQITSGTEGGIEQVITGLCDGLEQLGGDTEKYIVVGHWRGPVWRPKAGDKAITCVTAPPPPKQSAETIKDLFGPLRSPLGKLKRWTLGRPPTRQALLLPSSDGFYESLAVDLVHITYPLNFVLTSVPIVMTMHDLQHRHFPEFFSEHVVSWREATYPRMFHLAKAIVTISQFCKEDIAVQYGVDPGKIYVIPLAPQNRENQRITVDEVQVVRRKYGFAGKYILYPALTYQHKNHIRLLEAIAILVERGQIPPVLVCTGARKHHWPVIQRKIAELGLEKFVVFPGFIPNADLVALYHGAKFVILPTLFEGAGLPLIEAFHFSKSVACADIPAFREYGSNAPLYFDPTDPHAIAGAINRMSHDAELRATIAARGEKQVRQFSWVQTASMHRSLYRKLVGAALSEDDRALIKKAQGN